MTFGLAKLYFSFIVSFLNPLTYQLLPKKMDNNVSQAQAGLWNMTFGYLKTMSLKCALDLGIPDAIDNNGHPMTLSQLHSVLALPQRNIIWDALCAY
ncbi:trans-resveratrol di-O-methyltransferase-like protein [Carex littledalei]|uniref:Trans-resveratrol di-O-methyltransferase-like protein n=1 Tax=Carex littledalei TaxID=544730 RepID=A0A833QLW2_9POAL|nr:trans-resveratrol di-O-methyltransferase-like protein [Carex littledalei]